MSFSARQISLNEHPDWIAVIDGRDGDMERAAKELAFRIASVDVLAAVVSGISQEWDPYVTRHENARNMSVIANALGNQKQGDHIQIGHATPFLHIDRVVDRSPLAPPQLLGGLTGTMSFNHGGTCIVKRPREDFMRDAEAKQWLYVGDNYEGRLYEVEDAWQAQDGNPFWIKARDWPEEHLPGVHFSPLIPGVSADGREIMRIKIGGHPSL